MAEGPTDGTFKNKKLPAEKVKSFRPDWATAFLGVPSHPRKRQFIFWNTSQEGTLLDVPTSFFVSCCSWIKGTTYSQYLESIPSKSKWQNMMLIQFLFTQVDGNTNHLRKNISKTSPKWTQIGYFWGDASTTIWNHWWHFRWQGRLVVCADVKDQTSAKNRGMLGIPTLVTQPKRTYLLDMKHISLMKNLPNSQSFVSSVLSWRPSHPNCHWLKPKRGLSLVSAMWQGQMLIAATTDSLWSKFDIEQIGRWPCGPLKEKQSKSIYLSTMPHALQHHVASKAPFERRWRNPHWWLHQRQEVPSHLL